MGKTKARNPIREEKILMSAAGLIVKNWYVLKNTEEELVLVSKGAGKTRRIKKTPPSGNSKGARKNIFK